MIARFSTARISKKLEYVICCTDTIREGCGCDIC